MYFYCLHIKSCTATLIALMQSSHFFNPIHLQLQTLYFNHAYVNTKLLDLCVLLDETFIHTLIFHISCIKTLLYIYIHTNINTHILWQSSSSNTPKFRPFWQSNSTTYKLRLWYSHSFLTFKHLYEKPSQLAGYFFYLRQLKVGKISNFYFYLFIYFIYLFIFFCSFYDFPDFWLFWV